MSDDRRGAADHDVRAAVLDRLVARMVAAGPLRFTVAERDEERELAYRLRHDAVLSRGWARAEEMDAGREHDAFDVAALHVLGWDGPTAVCAGRLVLPPGPLPTEEACSLVVEPRGEVVDVGRMVVAAEHQDAAHATFVLLLAGLYLEVRRRGFSVACGMMSPAVRTLCRQLGFRLEQLAPDRTYWHEARAPVRFVLGRDAAGLVERWWDGAGLVERERDGGELSGR
jgi:N-acyl-L-homoserine lactone synthetase